MQLNAAAIAIAAVAAVEAMKQAYFWCSCSTQVQGVIVCTSCDCAQRAQRTVYSSHQQSGTAKQQQQ
eukprot:7829-Heterococcus_DN1.PRE.3